MEEWQKLIQDSITTLEDLQKHMDCDITSLREVIANFPMLINPYFLNLIQYPEYPIWKQVIPDSEGKGTIPITPSYIIDQKDTVTYENYLGEICTYPKTGDSI